MVGTGYGFILTALWDQSQGCFTCALKKGEKKKEKKKKGALTCAVCINVSDESGRQIYMPSSARF